MLACALPRLGACRLLPVQAWRLPASTGMAHVLHLLHVL